MLVRRRNDAYIALVDDCFGHRLCNDSGGSDAQRMVALHNVWWSDGVSGALYGLKYLSTFHEG